MRNITNLVSTIFGGIPCSIGSLPFLNVPEIDEDPYNIRYATIYGAILRAAKIEVEKEDEGASGSKIWNWFRRSGGRA